MKCPKCKALVVNGNFCTRCGAKLPKDNTVLNKTSIYDLSTVNGIMSIPVPQYPGAYSTENIEYFLQRKATEYKKMGQMDLAIACLRKSNELMPYSNLPYSAKDYLRLVKYIRLTGDNIAADAEEARIKQNHPELFDMRIKNRQHAIAAIHKAQKYNCDLIYISSNRTCPICSQYNRKTYSISGKSKTYPLLPQNMLYGGSCTNCIIGFNLVFK